MSTGEAVSLTHVAEDLERTGASCLFLASVGARSFIESRFAGRVQVLDGSLENNRRRWRALLAALRPHAIIFADYPLLFFSSGTPPLADDAWVEELDRAAPALVTLDHLGYAQGQRIVPFGPPHMTFGMEVTKALPNRMKVLVPCPIHDPGVIPRRRGVPFRAWSARTLPRADVQALRARFLGNDNECLVLFSTPGWAVHLARALGLPHHRFLAQWLAEAFGGAKRPVVIVSVNAVELLAPAVVAGVRMINVPPMPPDDFELLVGAADLMLTDNAISVSLGKAVCSIKPCALLANSHNLADLYDRRDEPGARWAFAIERERPGATFPWDVFPIWSGDDLTRLGFEPSHPFRRGCARVEAFGGESTRAALVALLEDEATRCALADLQRNYVEQVATLPTASEALAAALA